MRARLVGLFLLVPGAALAQGEPAQTPPPSQEQTQPAPPPANPGEQLPEPGEANKDLVEVNAGGLTAAQAAARAQEASYAVQQQTAALAEAAAKVEETFYAFFPRLSLSARYTRLSALENPSLTGSLALVGTPAPSGTPNPPTVALAPFSFPVLLNQTVLSASIAVPLSDYALRISRAAEAAANAKASAELNQLAAKSKAQADAQIGFYNWLRALGGVTVSEQTLSDKKSHYSDTQKLFEAGSASKAELLRAEADVAAAEQQLSRAQSLSRIAEQALKIQLRLPETEQLKPGEQLNENAAAVEGNLQGLSLRATTDRPEIRAVNESVKALQQQRAIIKAAYYPQLVGTAGADYADPNQRVFPQQDVFKGTWSAGLVLQWSPNDVLVTGQQLQGQDARIAQVQAQKQQLAQGLTLETTQAYEDFVTAQKAVATSKRQLAAADEGYRVARILYREGRMSQAGLDDVETQLTLARLSQLNTYADLQIARVRLDHAIGADALRIAHK